MVAKYSWVDVLFLVLMLGTAVYLAPIAYYMAVVAGICAGGQLQVILYAGIWRSYKEFREECPDKAAKYLDEQLGIKQK